MRLIGCADKSPPSQHISQFKKNIDKEVKTSEMPSYSFLRKHSLG